MKVLIRTVEAKGGGTQHTDTSVERGRITIGRATDQVVHIPDRAVPLSHSEIASAGNDVVIKASPGSLLFVNGKRVTNARLEPGDLVEVSSTSITVGELLDEDHDLVLVVTPGEVASDDNPPGAQYATSLDHTRLSRRAWSWILVAGIAVLCGLVPLLGVFDQGIAETLRNTAAPDDGQWDPGPLHPSHKTIGDNCNACHVEAFTVVRDQECVACHASISHHVDPSVHDIPELEDRRCASCHKEHNEPQVLVRNDQGLCSDCHSDLQASTPGQVDLADASDFERDHPNFKVSMLAPVGRADDTTWEVQRVALADGPVEDSNLIFPHDVHLADKGIDSPWGNVEMQCVDCHEPETDGSHMRPIRMADHCADCHRLEFDPDDADRVVPHGKPDEVVQIMREYYAAKFLEDRIAKQAVPVQSRRQARRPGESGGSTGSTGSAGSLGSDERGLSLDRVNQQAQRAAEDIFQRRTCVVCHEVVVDDSGRFASQWRVNPVQITRVWMPKSWFDHESHATETCESCHDARDSDKAADVLMPDIDNCRDCHGGEHTEDMLASSCISCHQFHIETLPLMKPWVEGAAERSKASALGVLRGTGPVRSMRTAPTGAREGAVPGNIPANQGGST